jgi:peptidoglycan hydrolase FlgJ
MATDYHFFTDAANSRKNPNDRKDPVMDTIRSNFAAAVPSSDRAKNHDTSLMAKAKELEASFLAEMLGHAGMDADPDGYFGGGLGEEQFASFLRQEQARMMVERGGVGLAEALFRAMGGGRKNG